MARLNVYVPDELAVAAREAGLNVSALTQQAITGELRARRTRSWLSTLQGEETWVSHESALAALDEARDEIGG